MRFKLTSLRKLYLELSIMILVGVVGFLILLFRFFSYESILIFVSDYWLVILILFILAIGIYDRIKGARKYKALKATKNNNLNSF